MGGDSGESYNKLPWELTGASNGGGMTGTLTGGDRPILRKLPGGPVKKGFYDVFQDYLGGMQYAYKLGVPPPEAPTPEAMMQWRVQTSPWAEETTLNKVNPQQLFRKRKETVEI